MDISIQTKKGKRLLFSFGFNTAWQSSIYWLDCTTEYFDDLGAIQTARYHWGFFKHPKFWFK